MYDHNNYPNDYHNNTGVQTSGDSSTQTYQNNAQNPYTGYTGYQNNTGNYQYGNTYPNDYTQMNQKKPKEKRPRKGGGYFRKAVLAVSLGLFFGLFAGLGLYIVESATGMMNGADTEVSAGGTDSQTEDVMAQAALTESGLQDTEQTLSGIQKTESVTTVASDVSDVASKVMPSIVAINNHYTEKMSFYGQTLSSDAESSGSGIIVGENDTELLIVTNYHVIEGADNLTVKFVEDSEAEASVKGTDADMDLAVIAVPLDQIGADTLNQIAVATLGDSDALVVGEPAIAIGNSLGYGQSVTIGVISALNRTIDLSDGSSGTFIQTDAAINPGNSGGALLNVKGEVIGINSNKIGGSAIEGMGYAIPISAAEPIIADLMLKETKNKVTEEERGYLGISGISVTADVSQAYGMPEGVYIAQVYEGTAAEAAGLQKGDIITAFDGDKITSMDTLQEELQFYAKGQTVEVTVMTVGQGGYQEKTVQLTLGNKVQ
ncbi:MAG: trypsin-like peptidase domain-containing protein [Lachnospiraceae bacterium]|nr:trypsin-like peptidase domain-containing protein [Lachnospiraceae bacterium]